jgi:GWxTD domain-containing protein
MTVKPVLLLIAAFALGAFPAPAAQPDQYQSWLDKDAHWIITEPERMDFQSLKTDAERDEFIVQFWQRRDPTPETSENEFKQEHYRRIAYANEHFTSKQEGALTDRGSIYIKYGPPDGIVRDTDSANPTEIWNYRALGKPPIEQTFRFVDSCACGEFQLKDEPIIYDPVR